MLTAQTTWTPSATTTARDPAHRMMRALLLITVPALIYADYLAPSLSLLALGSAGNWLLIAAGLQFALIIFAVADGRMARLRAPAGFGSLLVLALLGVGHLIAGEVSAAELSEYGVQKTVGFFAICMTAWLCGLVAGSDASLFRPSLMLLVAAPLLLACLVTMVIAPERMTIAYFYRTHVYLGVFVFPAHQSLAYAMAKIGLGLQALSATSSERRNRIWMWIGFALCTGCIAITGARTYILAFLGAIGVCFALGRRQIWIALLGIAVGYGFLHGTGTELVHTRLDLGTMLESRAFVERQAAWALAWSMFLEQPLFGHGPGGFGVVDNWGERSYPHNLLLEVACEYGIAGMLALTGLLLASVRSVLQLSRLPRIDAGQQFAIGLFVFSIIGAMSVGDLLRNHFLFLSIGLVTAAARRAPQ